MAQQVTSTQFQQAQEKKEQPKPNLVPTGSKLNQNFYARTRTTIYMLLAFIVILAAGQFYSACLVFVLNFLIFNEINGLKRNEEKQVNIPMTKYINWYLFTIVNYYCFGGLIIKKMPILGFWFPFVGQLLRYHNFICFCGLILGFLGFVLSLKHGYLKYQFRLFGWIVIATLLVCYQAWLMIHNIFEGMIWFIEATLLIIVNDIFAYLVGYFFGKHQLIALSPKKTWQGYIGGAILTFFFSLILTSALQEVTGMTCPMIEPNLKPFEYPTCQNNFHQTMFTILSVSITRLQIHMLVLSFFACIIGPFGGFFASGLKRSIKIKDFANLIPGHGGVSDRMDCQLIMGSFTYFYLHSIVLMSSHVNYWITLLTHSEQVLLYNQLKDILSHSIIPQ